MSEVCSFVDRVRLSLPYLDSFPFPASKVGPAPEGAQDVEARASRMASRDPNRRFRYRRQPCNRRQ
ncbi:hypothetical protein SBA4_2970012 [Candidatus Sulfopaludibacter sp. SbA4]|nr:hypothetical protein SBA4_2970012 [Candidatus Sulfopaludibacter sp. SbA4]